MKTASSKVIAITMGDAAGIGPEIIARAFGADPESLRGCFVAGDVAAMRRAAGLMAKPGVSALPVLELSSIDDVWDAPPHCIAVLQVGQSLEKTGGGALPHWGQVSAQAGEFAGRCVMWAADACLNKEIGAMVTAPLHKEALHAAGDPYNRFPGHTEMLQFRSASFAGVSIESMPVRMMLANDELRTVLVSIHCSLRKAIESVTFINVLETLQITHRTLSAMLGHTPNIAVAALNPHAGEGGLFGREEIEIIAPAIAAARAVGCNVSGPFAPDTIFMRARKSRREHNPIDAVVAMYHDQALIPVKYLGVEKGVNVTLGLPLVRTSPDHGTAFDIAGTARADHSSLLEAICMARKLC